MSTKILIIILLCLQTNTSKQLLASYDYVIFSNSNHVSHASDLVDLIETDIEQNLRSQLTLYLDAFLKGNVDEAFHHIYPDMLLWLKRDNPDSFSIADAKKFFKDLTVDLRLLEEQKGFKTNYELGDIVHRVDLGSEKIYTILTSLNAKKDMHEIRMGGEIIAITIDNGKTWKFIQKDADTSPEILRIRFSNSIVEKIMEKN